MNPSSIVKHCDEKNFHQDNLYCGYDGKLIDQFSEKMFDADYWQQQHAILGTAQGRGTTYFVKHEQQEWVLKHYYRGGLIGRVLHDQYWFTGYKNTRAAQEFQLMKLMEKLDLPAPKAVAYRIQKTAFIYRSDILTQRIPAAQDLVGILAKKTIPDRLWRKIGACIKQFHHHGIYHHDLNIHNILIDDHNKVWLIDFDRGEQRTPKQEWQQQNIERLLRSFHKENNKIANFHWHADNWQALMEGYLSQ